MGVDISKSRGRILVVEDDPDATSLYRTIFQPYYEVCDARSVPESQSILGKFPIDLILLDLSLEGSEDGLDLVRWCHSKSEYKHIPIIVVTAHALVEDREMVFAVGCNEYFSKPVRIEALEKTVYKYLS